MEVSDDPWVGLLWGGTNHRMITTPERQKVGRWLLFHAVGGDLSRLNTDVDRLREEYAGLLNRTAEEVDLPRYVD